MKIILPDLDFDPSNVQENRDVINQAIAAYMGAIKTLEGLHKANQGMCKHPNSSRAMHYDPGYAGGGYSHSSCKLCGARLL